MFPGNFARVWLRKLNEQRLSILPSSSTTVVKSTNSSARCGPVAVCPQVRTCVSPIKVHCAEETATSVPFLSSKIPPGTLAKNFFCTIYSTWWMMMFFEMGLHSLVGRFSYLITYPQWIHTTCNASIASNYLFQRKTPWQSAALCERFLDLTKDHPIIRR